VTRQYNGVSRTVSPMLYNIAYPSDHELLRWPMRAAMWLDSTVRCVLKRGIEFDTMRWWADPAGSSWIDAAGRQDLCAELHDRNLLQGAGVRVDPYAGVTGLGHWMTVKNDSRWEQSACSLALSAPTLLSLLPAASVDLIVLAPAIDCAPELVAELVSLARRAMLPTACLAVVCAADVDAGGYIGPGWIVTDVVLIGTSHQNLALLFAMPTATTTVTVCSQSPSSRTPLPPKTRDE
jgi:hypothetical protein